MTAYVAPHIERAGFRYAPGETQARAEELLSEFRGSADSRRIVATLTPAVGGWRLSLLGLDPHLFESHELPARPGDKS